MKRVFLMFISVMLIGLSANAQNATKARQILDKAAAKVGTPTGAKANFKMVSGNTTTTGTIIIKGNYYVSDNEIITNANLKNYPAISTINFNKIKNKLKKNLTQHLF